MRSPVRRPIVTRVPSRGSPVSVPSLRVGGDTAPGASSDSLWLAWLGFASTLVFFMQAGFALLEGGLARAKNSVNVVMKNFCDTATSTLVFWAIGYGLMFGANPSGWIGTDRLLPAERQRHDDDESFLPAHVRGDVPRPS